MRYISTRDNTIQYSASQAIAQGLAKDGGLLTPFYIPKLPGKALEDMGAGEAVFYLDAPVSNSGRLKQRIIELLGSSSLKVQAEVIHNVDAVLETKDYVITADAIILDKCVSWVNLNRRIMEEAFAGYPYVDFMRPEPVRQTAAEKEAKG